MISTNTLPRFNLFDAVVVSLSLLDLAFLAAMESSPQWNVMRGFRVIRILRVLRMARTLKVFSSLRILVSGVIASFVALFWSMVLLSIVMLIAALFLCQIVGESMEDPSADDDRKAWAYRFYGTSSRSTWTVFEFTFSGGWPTCARPLVEGFGAKYAVFFALYISAVTFAMFRIISALFLKDTLRAASLDFDTTIEEKMAEKRIYTQKLADFFYAADESGDGFLSLSEVEAVLEDERLRAYLATLELDAAKLRDLFSNEGEEAQISIADFVEQAMDLKGAARAQDLAALMRELLSMRPRLDGLESAFQALVKMHAV